MFSQDDVHRGRRWPLLWVFVPLIGGALLVTLIGIGIRASQGFPDIELAADLEELASDGDPLLAEVTGFEWNRVCVITAGTSKEAVDEVLGFGWGVIGGDTIDDRDLLVFVRGDEVVKHFYLRRGLVGRPATEGACHAPGDEETRL